MTLILRNWLLHRHEVYGNDTLWDWRYICELCRTWPIWPILQKFRPILTPTFWSFFLKNPHFSQNLVCGTKKLDQLQKKYFFTKSYTIVLSTPSIVLIEKLVTELVHLKIRSWKCAFFEIPLQGIFRFKGNPLRNEKNYNEE